MTTKVESRMYEKNMIYVPKPLWVDSAYDFEKKDEIEIEISDGKLIIKKIE